MNILRTPTISFLHHLEVHDSPFNFTFSKPPRITYGTYAIDFSHFIRRVSLIHFPFIMYFSVPYKYT